MSTRQSCKRPSQPGTALHVHFDARVPHASDDALTPRQGAYLTWRASMPEIILIDAEGRTLRIESTFLQGWRAETLPSNSRASCALLTRHAFSSQTAEPTVIPPQPIAQ